MNERIDVLAVMDRVIELERNWGDHGTANAVTEARAAVAELIEAAKEIQRIVEVRARSSIDRGRLIAAIAGVGGNHE